MANTLPNSDLTAILDNIAQQVEDVRTAYGDEATPGTCAYGAKLIRDRIVAFADPLDWDIEADLLPPAISMVGKYETVGEMSAKVGSMIAAINNHCGGGGLPTYLDTQQIRVHPNVRSVYSSLRYFNVFHPTAVDLASVEVTGAGVGTLTDEGSIDRNLFAGSQLEVVALTIIGAANITAITVSGTDEDGGAVVLPGVTLPSGSAIGTTVAIGTIANRLVDVTGITFAGGTANDEFRIRTKVERVIAYS